MREGAGIPIELGLVEADSGDAFGRATVRPVSFRYLAFSISAVIENDRTVVINRNTIINIPESVVGLAGIPAFDAVLKSAFVVACDNQLVIRVVLCDREVGFSNLVRHRRIAILGARHDDAHGQD